MLVLFELPLEDPTVAVAAIGLFKLMVAVTSPACGEIKDGKEIEAFFYENQTTRLYYSLPRYSLESLGMK